MQRVGTKVSAALNCLTAFNRNTVQRSLNTENEIHYVKTQVEPVH